MKKIKCFLGFHSWNKYLRVISWDLEPPYSEEKWCKTCGKRKSVWKGSQGKRK